VAVAASEWRGAKRQPDQTLRQPAAKARMGASRPATIERRC